MTTLVSSVPIEIEDASRAAALLGTPFLVASGGLAPSLATATGAFLLLAAEGDLRELRIPNRLTGTALLAVLLHACWVSGAWGLLASLAGAAAALGMLSPLYLLGIWGAGDLKALMVLGALFGASALPGLVTWALLAGGLISALAWTSDHCGRNASPDAPTRAPGIPFAPAIVLAVAAFHSWGSPWNL